MGKVGQRDVADRDEYAACMGQELCAGDHHHDNHHSLPSLAAPERRNEIDARDGQACADHE